MKRNALLPIVLCFLLNTPAWGQHSNHPAGPGIAFAAVPGGTFQMGDEQGDLWYGCRPVHTVTVSGFEMGVYEITNAQYVAYLNAVMESGDIEVKMDGDVYGMSGLGKGQPYLDLGHVFDDNSEYVITYSGGAFAVTPGFENRPVAYVTWYGAKRYALHYGFDLPTEAEWEYACRGGRHYAYGTDDGTIGGTNANYLENGPGLPVDIGSYPANPYGLHDMSGNVWEWCLDWYGTYPGEAATDPVGAVKGSSRVKRGGSWFNHDYLCRSAFRHGNSPDSSYDTIGFRVVRRPGGLTY